MTLSPSQFKCWISSIVAEFRSTAVEHPFVVQLWIGLLLVSTAVAGGSTLLSTPLTRQSVVNPLLVGVITLFTISLTITTMGIQLASNRYSYRLDSSVLQIRPVGLHFLPHLLAVLAGVFLLSTAQFSPILFYLFIFFSAVAILSIFPFLLWLLGSLTPNKVLMTSINQIDDDYLSRVEDIVDDEREKFFNNPRSNANSIYNEVTYSQTTENDPIDAVSDIIRSSIAEEDTGTAKRVLNKYVDQLEPTITDKYRTFKTSHSDSQLVCWYAYAPLEDIFRHALKHDNHIISIEIISLLRDSIVSWYSEDRDIPEVFLRLFGRITNDYAMECDRSQLHTVASDYSSVAKIIAEDIDSPHTRINGAMKINFGDQCLAFAIEAIERDSYRSARVITHGLRSIIEARLRIPSGDPKRSLLALGLIGEKFAAEEARSKQIVAVADEVSVMDEAEWVTTTLVTFLDKIDEYGNDYTSQSYYRNLVVNEINRINDALEPRNKDIATMVSEEDSIVIEVVRASRFFRSSFTPNELLEEMDIKVDVETVSDVCDSLVEADVMELRDRCEYATLYDKE